MWGIIFGCPRFFRDSFRPLAQRVLKQTSETQATLAPELHYIINDHAGTARELCSEEGRVEWRGQQTLWGEYKSHRRSQLFHSNSRPVRLRMEQAANDPVNCDLRYQGQLFDSETGLYYNRHRYYDPDSCQYLSPDPIGMAGGIRLSAYVHNPMEWVDPLGLTSCELSKAMEKNGTPRPDDSAAHHIVGETSKLADPARKVLEKHGIDINGADNGVFLPNINNTSDMPGILHNGRHPNDYLKAVNDRIISADNFGGKQSVLNELSAMRNTLSSADRNSSWNTLLIRKRKNENI